MGVVTLLRFVREISSESIIEGGAIVAFRRVAIMQPDRGGANFEWVKQTRETGFGQSATLIDFCPRPIIQQYEVRYQSVARKAICVLDLKGGSNIAQQHGATTILLCGTRV